MKNLKIYEAFFTEEEKEKRKKGKPLTDDIKEDILKLIDNYWKYMEGIVDTEDITENTIHDIIDELDNVKYDLEDEMEEIKNKIGQLEYDLDALRGDFDDVDDALFDAKEIKSRIDKK